MPPDSFHPNFYLVTASFSNDQHTIISQFIKPVDVEQNSCLEGLCSRGGQGWSLFWVYWAGSKWDFWSWRDFSRTPGAAPVCCPPAEELPWTKAGMGVESAHPREAESLFSSIKWPQGICGVCLEKNPAGWAKPLWPSGAPEMNSWTHTGQAKQSQGKVLTEKLFVSILFPWMFHEAFDSFRFSCLENIDHGFGVTLLQGNSSSGLFYVLFLPKDKEERIGKL